MAERRWKVDAARGVAVLLMVGYHFFFDLNYLGLAALNLYEGFFLLFQRTTAALFLGLVGVSLVLFKQKHAELRAFVERGAKIGAAAVLVTLAMFAYPGHGAIVWGVLHFIALAVVLGFFFLRFYWLNLALGLALLTASLFVSLPALSTPALLWLGFPPANFYTLDYYPLFPWFGLVLLGIFVGKTFYGTPDAGKTGRVEDAARLRKPFGARALEWVGRNALLVYLLHQPVLVAVLLAAKTLLG